MSLGFPQVFTARGFEAVFPWPGLCSLSCSPVLPGSSARKCRITQSSTLLRLLQSGCPSPPLLPASMNVSSLTPWLLDFHTVQFSGTFSCLLFLNLLLSFFWLCEEAKLFYLCLHLGWRSPFKSFNQYLWSKHSVIYWRRHI